MFKVQRMTFLTRPSTSSVNMNISLEDVPEGQVMEFQYALFGRLEKTRFVHV